MSIKNKNHNYAKHHYLEFTVERIVTPDDLDRIREAPQKSGERGTPVNAHFAKQIDKLKEKYKAKGLFMKLVSAETRQPHIQTFKLDDGSFYVRTTYNTNVIFFLNKWSDEADQKRGV